MAVSGPNLQLPSFQAPVTAENSRFTKEWQAFFSITQLVAFASTRSGPSAQRPTSSTGGRYVGMQYFDTTLGYPIWLKSTTPDVWVRWDGTSV